MDGWTTSIPLRGRVNQNDRTEINGKVHPLCIQPSDRGRLKNRTAYNPLAVILKAVCAVWATVVTILESLASSTSIWI